MRATSDAASLMLTAFASLLAGLGVAAGAVAAHAGSAFADPQAESWLQTASQYQIWHALAIMLLAMIRPVKLLWPAALMLVGVVLFCGSLYARSFGLIQSTPLAPWGGLALMAALLWTALQCFFAVFSSRAKADC